MAGLYIHNDDKHSFNEVHQLLFYTLGCTMLEADSMANIINNNGKCCIKYGTPKRLEPILEIFSKNGFKAEIKNETRNSKRK